MFCSYQYDGTELGIPQRGVVPPCQLVFSLYFSPIIGLTPITEALGLRAIAVSLASLCEVAYTSSVKTFPPTNNLTSHFIALPDVSPTRMICFGDSTFLQHVVAHIDKDLKLLFSGESICSVALFHHSEHLCL